MQKDIPLEALRGIAALSVLVWHTTETFFPEFVVPDINQAQSIRGAPWFVFMNGYAAVNLFFVLSAFVLTRRYFQTGDDAIIVRGALKRWPRLAGPVLVTVIASWILFKSGAYYFEDVSKITGSPWILGALHLAPYDIVDGSFRYAVAKGAFLTFFRGDNAYNGVLWTMHPEFIGSFIAFALALILLRTKPSSMAACLLILGVVALCCHYSFPAIVAFPVGVALALLLPRGKTLPSAAAIGGLVVALYCLGYSGEGLGIFAWPDKIATVHSHADYINVLGAALLISLLETWPPIRSVLSGRGMALIGELSFPIYLVHIPVICSAGCFAFVTLTAMGSPYARIAAAPVSLALVFAFALVLMRFNRSWLAWVNRGVSLVLSRTAPHSLPRTPEGY